MKIGRFIMSDKKTPKKPQKYVCEICDFFSNNLKDYKRHCLTIKHKNGVFSYNSNKKTPTTNCFECMCGKVYKFRSGLTTHSDKCMLQNAPKYSKNMKEETIHDCEYCGRTFVNSFNLKRHYERCKLKAQEFKIQTMIIDTLQNELVKKDKQLLEQKQEITKKEDQIKELLPKVGHGNVTFNINNFLNDNCKNAISLDSFVNNIKFSLDQLIFTKNEGITSGISHIIMDNMNKLALHERPIHCSDKKREVLYIKNDTWEKDTNKKNTKYMIERLCHKQVVSINKLITDQDDDFIQVVDQCAS